MFDTILFWIPKFNCKKNDDIFKYINPDDNIILSDLSGKELQDFLWYVNNYYLEFREKLKMEPSITFGLELEFEYTYDFDIKQGLKQTFNNDSWELKPDGSLVYGMEINSPILTDTKQAWQDLKKVCEIIKKNAKIGKKSGGHIHFGTQAIGDNKDYWLNFIMLYSVYENVIFRFLYGEYLTERLSILTYASPLKKTLWKDYLFLKENNYSTKEIINLISHNKYQAVSFEKVNTFKDFEKDNTFEFRSPHGSDNPIIWQNNVNFIDSFSKYVTSSNFNEDIILKRHEIIGDKYSSLQDYNEIYLEQAIELCDMLFENNLDKIYFLRQYLKSFQIGNKPMQKAKVFTKKM